MTAREDQPQLGKCVGTSTLHFKSGHCVNWRPEDHPRPTPPSVAIFDGKCKGCGTYLPLSMKFCCACGTKTSAGEAQGEAPRDDAKRKLAVVNESIDTHRTLIQFAGSVKAFLSQEFGEHLPGERADVDAILAEIAEIEGTL